MFVLSLSNKRRKIKKIFSIFLLFAVVVSSTGVLMLLTPTIANASGENWLAGWTYRKQITISNTNAGSTTLTDFPVLIKISASTQESTDLANALANGYDIRFTDSAGNTLLPYERETWTGGGGSAATANFWVKTTLNSDNNSATADVIYMYYGNASVSGTDWTTDAGSKLASCNSPYTTNVQCVWDGNYNGVWHFKETGTNPTVNDSTSNAGNSSVNAWTPTASSKIGAGGQLVSGTNHIEFPDSSAFDSINTSNAVTVSMWINWSGSTEAYNELLGRYGNGGGAAGTELLLKSNGKLAWYVNNAGNNIDGTGTNTLQTGNWYYVTAVYSTAGGKAYVNGAQDASVGYGSACGTTNSVPMQIGHDQFGSGRYFRGYFDEARISNTVRSADWIKFEYHNQADAGNSLTYATEESLTAPDAPTGLTPTAGNTQVSLSWTAPVNDGGSAITDYVIDYKLTSEPTVWSTFADGVSTNTTGTVTGLTNGLSYDFRVSAVNTVGQGSASDTATETPATVPGAPTIGTATRGNASASVTFSAPASDGGSAITGYTVTSSPGGFTGTGGSSPVTVSGLTNGTAYTFTVTATNAMGTGAASAASNSVTPATVPGAPTAISATAGNVKVTLSWSAPASDGGSAITDYVIEYKLTSDPDEPASWQIASDPETSVIVDTDVTGLINGTSYDFRISAVNDVGAGSPSSPLVSSTPRTVPGAPTITSAVSGNTQVTVTFTAPVSNGGSVITGYTVTSNDGGSDSNAGSTELSHIVTGLTNGTAYTFTVTATNIAGTGPASDPSSSVTPATVPDAPTGLIATPGNAQVSLSWTAPAFNGGADITDYLIEYKLHSDPSWSQFGHTPSAATTIIVTGVGLVNGSEYDFQVSAINSAGTSDASTPPVSSTPRTVPDAPTIGTATRGNAQASVSFSAPASNGGSAITGYTVTSNPQGITQSGASSPIVVTGLTNGTAYTFTVTAANIAGTGSASDPSNSVTPATVPGVPTNVSAAAGNAQATVTFTAPASNGGSAITGYTVTSNNGGSDSNAGSTELSHVVTGLTSGSTYTFTVVATNDVGSGLASDASSPVTLPTEPTEPLNLAAVVKSSSIDLTWSAPASNGGSAITDYVIEYQLTTGGSWAPFDDGVSASQSATVTGLSNGTSYDFRVSAKNIVGQSGPSNSVSATPGEPAQVLIQSFPDLTNTSIGTAVRITNEGSVEYEYQYAWCVTDAVDNLCGGGNDVFSASNAKLITPGENYDFTATSTVPTPGDYYFHISVQYGSQTSTAYQSFTAVATYPDPPTSVSAVAGNAQATISFTAPASNGGSAITGYTVTSNPGGLTGTGASSPITVTGLTNGTAYTFTMTATNAVGTGLSSSPPTDSVTPATVPGAINSLSASAGNTQVGLFWSAPASDGGSAITDYVIEYKLSSDSSWAVFADGISTAVNVTVTGLTNNLSYDFRVSAVNAIGQGPVNSTSATSVTPPTNTGGGSSSGGYYHPPVTVPPNTPTTTPNVEIVPTTTPNTVSETKVPKTISPTTPSTKPIKNEVSTTPTETSHITPPVKQKQTPVNNSGNKEASGVPWVWIVVSLALVFFTGFIIFILRRRRMDGKNY